MEVLRRQFGNDELAQSLRHAARNVLLPTATTSGSDWIDDALIVISELVQNVTRHTRSYGELILTLEPGTLLIEVGDTSTIVPRLRHPAPTQAGGRGLLLIEAISHHWGVRTCPAGKAVWARLATSPNTSQFGAISSSA